ncbi:UDP-N-acetylmuramyl-tripeptide synthetase [Sulfobacillus acidophilus TPY]|uniref:UDP-N-acetylmuramyl-tripeptide synthetase n=1 Tax=Sulfobacillus acidophilus (strain ATCC 700253 / DSM 10332 / NAL) TaxID=679936 RepID=G8TYK4_SULAD|nr:UDP-N-acetylmuramyl-tripeptide synthetase [Sulfobacillus acidophilus TPY]AEW06265.1 UDP-N-acetylmuramoylalanyl-D-glutamate--2,6-diaminopimelate ligase [Sulfobacillus acidophilus DSM 10332]
MGAVLVKTASGWSIGPDITGVAIDSRMVQPGNIFVAIPGAVADGHQFIADAIQRGAVAVVGEKPLNLAAVPYFQVPSSRVAAAELAALVFGRPSEQLAAIGVTGTNGKTSVVYWLTHLLRSAGRGVGMISSVMNETGRRQVPAELTTPESPDLQAFLRDMVDVGYSHAVIEVSSHGIAQHRIDHIRFQLAVLTNITREHLDFHGTMDHYIQTKAQLFLGLAADSLGAVINADDYYSRRVLDQISAPVITYGIRDGDVRAHIVKQDAWSSRVRLEHPGFTIEADIFHPGTYNVYNVAATVAAGYRLGLLPAVMEKALPTLPAVPGRMQVFRRLGHPTVVVDYAHTPDGLEQSLKTVREFNSGRVWLIFGARGGRDRGKRPEMGRIAATYADHVVLTTDSPYFEDPREILRAIETGINQVDPNRLAWIELDRAQAITEAVLQAQQDDIVLITGRGPEHYQYFGNQKVLLHDAEVVEHALKQRQGREDSHVGGIR